MTETSRAVLVMLLAGVIFVFAGALFGFNGVAGLLLALIALLAVVSIRDQRADGPGRPHRFTR